MNMPGTHKSAYYRAAVKKKIPSTLYMEKVIVPPLSVVVSHDLQHKANI